MLNNLELLDMKTKIIKYVAQCPKKMCCFSRKKLSERIRGRSVSDASKLVYRYICRELYSIEQDVYKHFGVNIRNIIEQHLADDE